MNFPGCSMRAPKVSILTKPPGGSEGGRLPAEELGLRPGAGSGKPAEAQPLCRPSCWVPALPDRLPALGDQGSVGSQVSPLLAARIWTSGYALSSIKSFVAWRDKHPQALWPWGGSQADGPPKAVASSAAGGGAPFRRTRALQHPPALRD